MVNPPAHCGSPSEWANREQAFEIKGKVGDFRRLVEIVQTDLAEVAPDTWPADWQNMPVQAQVLFAWADEAGTCPLMSGRLSAGLAALCQRCLEPFVLSIAVDIDLLLRSGDDSLVDDSGHEVWDIAGDKVCVTDIVEELLVMALPFSAKHEAIGMCGPLVAEAPGEDTGAVKPFAKLRAQLDGTK